MGTGDGLRERKKGRTRRAIFEAGIRLFAERGYHETTVADIAAAADIAPRTFFSYFPAKEDVLFAGIDDRIRLLASELELRKPGESLIDAARRVIERLVMVTNWDDLAGEAAEIRWQLITGRPSLQGALLLRLRAAEEGLAARLHAAYPQELDGIVAAAIVGMFTSGLRAVPRPQSGTSVSPRKQRAAVERLLLLAERGLSGMIDEGETT